MLHPFPPRARPQLPRRAPIPAIRRRNEGALSGRKWRFHKGRAGGFRTRPEVRSGGQKDSGHHPGLPPVARGMGQAFGRSPRHLFIAIASRTNRNIPAMSPIQPPEPATEPPRATPSVGVRSPAPPQPRWRKQRSWRLPTPAPPPWPLSRVPDELEPPWGLLATRAGFPETHPLHHQLKRCGPCRLESVINFRYVRSRPLGRVRLPAALAADDGRSVPQLQSPP